jgi:hypothetical protein
MNLASKFLAIAFVCAASTTLYGQVESRLLPDSFTKGINFSWRQDGRVVEIQITNPKDKWVLQQLAIEVKYPPVAPVKVAPPLSDTKKSGTTGARSLIDALDEVLREELPEKHTVSIELQPGKSSSSHLELTFDRKITSASLVEIRGREQSRFERLWNSVR